MKRYLLLVLMILAFCHPLMAVAEGNALQYVEEGQVKGDANGDGWVNINDVSFIINILLGKEMGDYSLDAVDVNSDGMVNIVDITVIINIILHIDDNPDGDDDTPPVDDDDANPNLPVLIIISSQSPPQEAD